MIVWGERQLGHIRKGGMLVVFRKIVKLFWLLFMSISAPLTVLLDMDWPNAYCFMGERNLRKLKKIKSQANPSDRAIKDLEEQTIGYFKKIVDQKPSPNDDLDWLNANQKLRTLYYNQGKLEAMHEMCQKDAEFRQKMAELNQYDDLEIEFLPSYLSMGSIGNYEHLDIYIKAGKLGLRPEKKIILLVDHKESVNNLSYLNCWRPYITVITDSDMIQLLKPLEKRFEIPLNHYMFLHGEVRKSFLALGSVCEQWIREKREPVLKITDMHRQRGLQSLKAFGLSENDWFVCFHVRESGWKDKDSRGNDFRDADIDTYQSAMKAVTDAGGWVFRMGDSTMKPMPKMPRVIDYAHSEAKSDWMDVFLCAQCRFFVTTASGLHLFAITFGKPIVMTNSLPTCGIYFLTSEDLFIPKLLIRSREGRPVKFSELLVPPLAMADVTASYDKEDVEIVNNNEDDIKELVDEMLERFAGTRQYSERDERLQMQFKSVASDCGKHYGKECVVAHARIGRNWLRQYVALLPQDANSGLNLKTKETGIGVE